MLVGRRRVWFGEGLCASLAGVMWWCGEWFFKSVWVGLCNRCEHSGSCLGHICMQLQSATRFGHRS